MKKTNPIFKHTQLPIEITNHWHCLYPHLLVNQSPCSMIKYAWSHKMQIQSEIQCSRKYQGTLSSQDYMPKIKNLIVKPIKTMVEPDAFAGSFQITGRHWLAEIVHLSSRIWKMATSITNWNMLRHQITPKLSHGIPSCNPTEQFGNALRPLTFWSHVGSKTTKRKPTSSTRAQLTL